MKTRLPCFLVAGLIAACCLIGVSRAAVFSIDFGSEWMKVALVKPGVPMEIVLNKESKRKTAAVVALRKDERLFGDAALNTAVKFPKSAYRYLQLLIGQKFDSPLVQKYKEWFPFYDLKKDEERGTVLFQHDKDTVYSVEELVGMLFNYSRQLVEDYAGIPIKDVVITVPPFFTQAQRRSVLYAASLVGLNVVQLMGDSAGAGLNYGVFRQQSFNTTPQYIMLYDMGASSTVASIIEYRRVQVKEGSRANLHPQLLVKGVGYDRLLGGFEIDTRLQQHLAKVFEGQKKSTQSSVYESPRAMAKLLKEAKRLKQVLSANTDHFAQIEGLHEDIDFRAKVSRAELEKICSDLFDRVGHPVREALESADMTMDEIDNVIIIGGGTRVPKVQEILLQAVGKPELGKNLNADEAVALGAVYQGAGHSKMFRVKKFLVKEGTIFPIQVSFSRVTRSEDGDEVITKTVKRTLFQRGNAYPQKKVLTFNRYSDDFPFQVFYGELDFLSNEELSYIGRLNISEVFMSGVNDALSSHQDGEAKGIKAHFRMDESGLLMLDYAESIFEYPDGVKPEEQSTLSKIGSTISSFFGGGSSSKEEDKKEEQDEGEEVAADGDGNETTTTTSDSHSTKEERTEPPQPDTEAEQEATDEENGQTEAEAEAGETESERGEETSEEDSQSRSEEEESSEEEEGEGAEQGEESEEEEKEAERGEEPEGEEKGAEQPSGEEIPQEEAVPQEDGQTAEAGEEASSEDTVNATNTTNGTSSTTAGKGKKDKASKKDKQQPPEVKENTVKINLTADVTVLDLPSPSQASATVSTNKLAALQQRDDDKVANEKAKNSLESHIFETKDAMYSEAVVTVTTAEQRETILAALTDAGNWLEDDGYFAETSVYKSKLRELKRASRAVFKRVAEMQLRPKLINHLNNSLNVSRDFLSRMKNLSTELQIFTDVEMTTLETLIEETEEWMAKMIAQQEATPAYEEPVLLSSEIEEQSKRLDREILYLLNKLRSHPPPRARNTTTNATNSSTASNTTKANSSKDETPSSEKATPTKDGTTPTKEEPSTIEEEQPEILELPETADSAQTVTDDEEPPLTDSSTELPSQSSEEKHQEL